MLLDGGFDWGRHPCSTGFVTTDGIGIRKTGTCVCGVCVYIWWVSNFMYHGSSSQKECKDKVSISASTVAWILHVHWCQHHRRIRKSFEVLMTYKAPYLLVCSFPATEHKIRIYNWKLDDLLPQHYIKQSISWRKVML